MIDCANCGTRAGVADEGTCLRCAERREAAFRSVRAFLYAHSGATVDEIARATGVRESEVFALLNEGRLTGRHADDHRILCSCGQHALESLDGRCVGCHNRLADRIARLPASVRDEFERWGAK